MVNVAENIKRLRTLRNMSQKEIALALGIDQGQYSRIETGKVEPTLSTLDKIATVFEVSLSEFFTEPSKFNEEINLPLFEKVKMIETLDEKERDCLMTIIDIAIAKKKFRDNLSQLLVATT